MAKSKNERKDSYYNVYKRFTRGGKSYLEINKANRDEIAKRLDLDDVLKAKLEAYISKGSKSESVDLDEKVQEFKSHKEFEKCYEFCNLMAYLYNEKFNANEVMLEILQNHSKEAKPSKEEKPEAKKQSTKYSIIYNTISDKDYKSDYSEGKFLKINEQYKHFRDIDEKIYKNFYNFCYEVSKNVEKNHIEGEIEERAYKMMLIFYLSQNELPKGMKNPETYAITLLNKFIEKYLHQAEKPIHDMFVHNIPSAPLDKISEWRKLIHAEKGGLEALKVFSQAKAIEEKNGGNVPKDEAELKEVLPKVAYKRASENLEYAKIFKKHNISPEIFDRTLDLIKSGEVKVKNSDKMPDIFIDGKDVGHPGYYMIKLRPGDPRGFIMGNITNCCQSIRGASEKCVIDYMTRQNNTCYMLVKQTKAKKAAPSLKEVYENMEDYGYEIVGQGYTWRSEQENFVIDSWEQMYRKKEEDDILIKDFITKGLAPALLESDKNASRVTIGCGGKTPDNLKENPVLESDMLLEGSMYGDSKKQSSLAFSKEFKEAFDKNKEFIKKHIEYSKEDSNKNIYRNDNDLIKVFQSLKDIEEVVMFLNNPEIKINNTELYLLSPYIIEYYKKHQNNKLYPSFNDLKGLSYNIVNLLISEKMLKYYEEHQTNPAYPSFDQSKDVTSYSLCILTLVDAIQCYDKYLTNNAYPRFSQLKELGVSKIEELTSPAIQKYYEKHKMNSAYPSFEDLKDLDIYKIKILTSEEAQECYEKHQTNQLYPCCKDLIKRDVNSVEDIRQIIQKVEKTISEDQDRTSYMMLDMILDYAPGLSKQYKDMLSENGLIKALEEKDLISFKEWLFKYSHVAKQIKSTKSSMQIVRILTKYLDREVAKQKIEKFKDIDFDSSLDINALAEKIYIDPAELENIHKNKKETDKRILNKEEMTALVKAKVRRRNELGGYDNLFNCSYLDEADALTAAVREMKPDSRQQIIYKQKQIDGYGEEEISGLHSFGIDIERDKNGKYKIFVLEPTNKNIEADVAIDRLMQSLDKNTEYTIYHCYAGIQQDSFNCNLFALNGLAELSKYDNIESYLEGAKRGKPEGPLYENYAKYAGKPNGEVHTVNLSDLPGKIISMHQSYSDMEKAIAEAKKYGLSPQEFVKQHKDQYQYDEKNQHTKYINQRRNNVGKKLKEFKSK